MIIILFTFVLLLVIVLIVKNKENFTNLINPKFKFLSKNEACSVLKSVKTLNDYNNLDFTIRKIDKKVYNNKVAKYYCENLEDFTKYEKELITWMYDNIFEKTPENLRFLYKKIKFAKYSNHIELGFPHTHKDTIFLTGNFISNLIPYYNSNDINQMIKNIGVVIIHECVHLWQRKDKDLFYKLYIYYWNFIKVNKIHNNILEHKIRYNPDGVNTNWVYNYRDKYYFIVSIYRENAVNIGQVDCVGVELEKNGVSFIMPHKDDLNIKKLNDITGFNYLFKNVDGNNYHPNELSAELISIYYMKKMDISHSKFNNKALDKLDLWYRNDVFKKHIYMK